MAYSVTFAPQGGTVEHDTLYYWYPFNSEYEWMQGWYTNSSIDTQYVDMFGADGNHAERPGYEFMGFWTNPDATGIQIDGFYGQTPDAQTLSWLRSTSSAAECVLYACWAGPIRSATLSLTNLSGGTARLFYNVDTEEFFTDEEMTHPLPSATVEVSGQQVSAWGPIVLPAKELYKFDGGWSGQNSTGTLYIDADGYILPALAEALENLTANDDLTIYAKGVQVSKKCTLSPNGGNGGWGAIYNSLADTSKWYSPEDDAQGRPGYLCLGTPITSVPIPGRIQASAAYVFNGYKSGATECITPTGELVPANMANKTSLTANWVATAKATINMNGGTGMDAAFYWCASKSAFYHEVAGRLTQASAIYKPYLPGYEFAGCRLQNNDTSLQVVAANGTISTTTSTSPRWPNTSAVTVYARWTKISWEVNFSGADIPPLYVKGTGGGLYRDADCTVPIENGETVWESLPTQAGFVFLGVFAGETTASTPYVSADGEATYDFVNLAASADVTVYCLFAEMQPIDLDANGGTGGATVLWYIDHALYSDPGGRSAVEWPLAALPNQEGCSFDGYFSGAGDTQYITADGGKTEALDDLVAAGISEPYFMVAQWTRFTWRYDLDNYGAIYAGYCCGLTGWFSDSMATTPITSVPVPVRAGYYFLGFYTNDFSRQVVAADGTLRQEPNPTQNVRLFAQWEVRTFTLSFSNGSASRSVTYGAALGTLPTPASQAGMTFVGWTINGSLVTAETVWTWLENQTAVPKYKGQGGSDFGEVEDWFRLTSGTLVPISSDSGDNRQRVAAYRYGRAAADGNQVSCVWRNPTVTYMVIGDMRLDVTLGKAFASRGSGSSMTVSGYMITSVRIDTGTKSFPTVTVSAVANEGSDAINTFRTMTGNAVGIQIRARARAQNLLSAVNVGSSHLHSLSLLFTCQPVVVAKDMAPCASDVVEGMMEVEAVTLAPKGESAPTATAGWHELGAPQATDALGYQEWRIAARKEMR